MIPLDPPRMETLLCRACGREDAVPWGFCDFGKSCEPGQSALTGQAVYYHRCAACGLIFTAQMDSWHREDFRRFIYNDEYLHHDPEFAGARAQRVADDLALLLRGRKPVLWDWGAGNGSLVRALRAKGFDAGGSDVFGFHEFAPTPRIGITLAIEVLEHLPSPDTLFEGQPAQCILFTSLLSDGRSMPSYLPYISWSYIAPRNGHICIYSREALRRLLPRYGLQGCTDGNNVHVAWHGEKPDWLKGLRNAQPL